MSLIVGNVFDCKESLKREIFEYIRRSGFLFQTVMKPSDTRRLNVYCREENCPWIVAGRSSERRQGKWEITETNLNHICNGEKNVKRLLGYSLETIAKDLCPISSDSNSDIKSTLKREIAGIDVNDQLVRKISRSISTSSTKPREKMKEITIKPMGEIRSCYREKFGTPRQGAIVRTSRAILVLNSDLPESCVDDLAEFSHLWLIFMFEQDIMQTFKPKVRPPRLNGKKTGVFSTRSPHRYNPIGMSVVSIDRIEQGKIFISGIDLIDGTVIVDIKPYHFSDSIPLPSLCLPEWVSHGIETHPVSVVFEQKALEQFHEIFQTDSEFYPGDSEIALETVRKTLEQDPRSALQKKRGGDLTYEYVFRFDKALIKFVTDQDTIRVISVTKQ